MKKYWIVEGIVLLGNAFLSGLQLVYGVYKLSKLRGPIISVFGGKGASFDSSYGKQAYALGQLCVQHGFSVITGGGPGSMEAAQCGAQEYAQKAGLPGLYALGIGVRGVDGEFTSQCVPVLNTRHMYVRKLLLIRYSCAVIVLPGGLGTADELFEVLNLKKLDRISQIPVILLGISYWQSLIDWYIESGIKKGFIRPEYKDLYTITDDFEHAMQVVSSQSKGHHL